VPEKAFTLVEIIVTMVVVAIIAAWGVPNYQRSVLRTKVQSVMQSMKLIYFENVKYSARNRERFCTSPTPGVNRDCFIDEINNMNGAHSLSIIVPSDFQVFQCRNDMDSGDILICFAQIFPSWPTVSPPDVVVTMDLRCPLSETPQACTSGNPNPYCSDIAGKKICP
jgi:prepilin-type N-terminal cleavage/methylation domain-containing protein